MTKTQLILLLGGVCACASLAFGLSAAAQRSTNPVLRQAPVIAWEQPPCLPPGGKVIVKGAESVAPLPV